MPNKKIVRILEIESLVNSIDFKDKGFKRALRFECKQKDVNFNRLRHYVDSHGVEVYVETWRAYSRRLKEEGVSSKLLIQSYHHNYLNLFNQRVFENTINYLRSK